MTTVRLEHANLYVRDIDSIVRFIQTAIPEFQIRYDSKDKEAERWVHVGTENTYLALSAASVFPKVPWEPYVGKPGVNHLAYVVTDVDSLQKRLLDAGYTESTIANNHPARKRIYFRDPEGNDWEFLQYLTDDLAQRNDYSDR